MSDKRYDLDEAAPVALALHEALLPFSAETPEMMKEWPWPNLLAIVGSLRRQKDSVGDIELLYVPRYEDRQLDLLSSAPMNLATEKIGQLVKDGTLEQRLNCAGNISSWGRLNKHAVHMASGIPIDLFETCKENWFVSLVIRTGSKDTNLRLAMGAQKLNRTLHAYGEGVSEQWPDGSVQRIRATSEEHVFQLCGVPYLEPHRR